MNELTTYNVPKEIEKKILAVIDMKKQVEEWEHEIKQELQGAMEANNIVSIKNETYTVSLASRSTYSGKVEDIDPLFVKTVLDASKVGTHEKLYGELPAGVGKKESKYLTWRAK